MIMQHVTYYVKDKAFKNLFSVIISENYIHHTGKPI